MQLNDLTKLANAHITAINSILVCNCNFQRISAGLTYLAIHVISEQRRKPTKYSTK